VNAYFVLSNATDQFFEEYYRKYSTQADLPPIILAEIWPGYTRPYIESRIVAWARRFGSQLKGVVILGEYVLGGSYELGAIDQIRVTWQSTREAEFPMIQTKWEVWFALRDRLNNGSLVNVTITDDGPNQWRTLRTNGWFAAWISISSLLN
jgi:hypothetical protein